MTEEDLIGLVIDRNARQRFKESMSNQKKRQKVLDKLNHNPPLDERYTTWYNKFQAALDSIKYSSSDKILFLSASNEIDGKTLSISEGLEKMYKSGWGTILGFNSKLALYYGEEGERGAVIKKD